MKNLFKFLFSTIIIYFHRKTNQAIDFEVRGNQNKKILIIAYGALGDFIICSPVFQLIRKKFSNAEIHLVAGERNADLARRSGWFKKVWSVRLNTIAFDRNNWKTVQAIRDSRYSLVINLFDEPDDVALAKILVIAKNSQFISIDIRKKSKFQGFQLKLFKKFFMNRKFFSYPAQSEIHFLERIYKITEFWSNSVTPDFRYIFPDIDPTTVVKPIDAKGKIYVHPYGSQRNNCLDLGVIKSITETLGENNYFLPTIKNKFTGDKLKAHYPDAVEFKTLYDLAAVIKDCTAVVSVDTDTAHLAVALDKPLFLIRANEDWRQNFDPKIGHYFVFKSDNTKIESIDLIRLQNEIKKFVSKL